MASAGCSAPSSTATAPSCRPASACRPRPSTSARSSTSSSWPRSTRRPTAASTTSCATRRSSTRRRRSSSCARVVDELNADVHALGLLTDFRGKLFEGSARFLELADERQELQVEARCWCGARATQNARRRQRQAGVRRRGRGGRRHRRRRRGHLRAALSSPLAPRRDRSRRRSRRRRARRRRHAERLTHQGRGLARRGALLHAPRGAVVDEQVEERRGRERLGTEHAGAGPRAARRAARGRSTGLMAVCHTTAWLPSRAIVSSLSARWYRYTSRGLPVLAGAGHPRAGARAAAHPVAEGGRVGEAGGDDVARRHLVAAHRHRVGAVEADLVEHLEHLDELVTEAVLEGDPVGSRPTAG